MIHTTELYRLLKQMEAVLRGSETLRAANATASWTNEAALRQLVSLNACALHVIADEPIPSDVAATEPRSQSSVEIESRVKGEPGIKVKAYTGSDLEDPAARAVEMFRRLRYQLTEETQVQGRMS